MHETFFVVYKNMEGFNKRMDKFSFLGIAYS